MSAKIRTDASDVSGEINKLWNYVNDIVATINNAAGQTLTAAQVYGGYIIRSGAAGVSDTLPTAAQIVAAMPSPQVGDTTEFTIVNQNSGTLTLVAGTGVTLSGTTSIATVFSRKYLVKVTAIGTTPTVTVYGIMTGAN